MIALCNSAAERQAAILVDNARASVKFGAVSGNRAAENKERPPVIETVSRYLFTDYSAKWPAEFEQENERVRLLLGEDLIRCYHIGSTSVPGLAAKPIIDLLPVVRSIERLDACTPQFEAAGYQAWGEYGLAGRRYFTKDRAEYRTHNLHIYQEDNPEIERHLAFCAYLRAHQNLCEEYASLKREAYAHHPADVAAYNDHKNRWIKRIERLAVNWYREQTSPGHGAD